jgi:hypothetical protein
MASSLLTPTVILKAAAVQLENSLIYKKLVYNGYSKEFGDTKVGDTVYIRRPVKYAIRTGNVAQMQDVTEGKLGIKIDTQRGVDLRFPSKDMTLAVDKFAERYLKHPMIALGNQIDLDIAGLYKYVPNWVVNGGTFDPAKKIGSYKDMAVGAERLKKLAVPGDLTGALDPSDQFALAASFTSAAVYAPDLVRPAIEKNKLPMLAGIDCYIGQNVPTHTTTRITGSPVVSSTAQTLSYAYSAVKDTLTCDLKTTGWDTSKALYQGDVVTIANVYAVNPVGGQTLPFLKQFVLRADVTTDGTSTNDTTISIYPAPIVSGPYKNCNAAPVAGAAVTKVGYASADATFTQSMIFPENAFAFVSADMELPEGAQKKSRVSYNGLSMRLIQDYDIINDINMWRFDILYGVAPVYPDFACRINGSTA